MDWHFDNTYARELSWLGLRTDPVPVAEPQLLFLGEPLARELRLDVDWLREHGAAVFAGSVVPDGADPIAMAYAGHQFGFFSPRLGDGRAHLLGEVVDERGDRRDIALKGSGRTVFSRGGDGRAAIGPVLREVLMSEAMHALRIPTTRSLGAAETGEQVWRDNGPERGAVLCRVAASHLRVGTLELVRTQGSLEQLRELVEYVRARHYPHVAEGDVWALFDEIASRQAELIAQWMSIGFIHGVMNTDNMALSGETIDYGPCAFMDRYDPDTVFSSIDTGGRYRYSAQPTVAAWNLARLAETLLPLDEAGADAAVETATARVNGFPQIYAAAFRRRMAAKLGLAPVGGGVSGRSSDVGDIHPVEEGQGSAGGAVGGGVSGRSSDVGDIHPVEEGRLEEGGAVATLIDDLLDVMRRESLDWTNTFRTLSRQLRSAPAPDRDTAPDRDPSDDSPFLPNCNEMADGLLEWVERWRPFIADPSTAAERMDAVNPAYVPRNHLVEESLDAARSGDLEPFHALLDVIREPFDERPGLERYAEPAPERFAATYVTYCGT